MRSTVSSFPGAKLEKLSCPLQVGAPDPFMYSCNRTWSIGQVGSGQAAGQLHQIRKNLVRLPESGRGAPCGRPSWAIVTSEFRCDCPGASRLNQYPLPTAPEQRKCDKIGPSQKLAQNPATSNFQTRHHMRSPQRPALSIMPVAHRQAKPLSAQDAAPPKLPPQQTVKMGACTVIAARFQPASRRQFTRFR